MSNYILTFFNITDLAEKFSKISNAYREYGEELFNDFKDNQFDYLMLSEHSNTRKVMDFLERKHYHIIEDCFKQINIKKND